MPNPPTFSSPKAKPPFFQERLNVKLPIFSSPQTKTPHSACTDQAAPNAEKRDSCNSVLYSSMQRVRQTVADDMAQRPDPTVSNIGAFCNDNLPVLVCRCDTRHSPVCVTSWAACPSPRVPLALGYVCGNVGRVCVCVCLVGG